MKWFFLAFLLLLTSVGFADQAVYSDALASGWSNWSWATVNLSCTSPVHSGKESISVTETAANQALYLHVTEQNTPYLHALVFWINGGATGGQLLQVQATISTTAQVAYSLPPLTKNTWTKVVVPLTGVAAAGVTNFDGFWIQDRSNSVQGVYYVDDISITSLPTSVVDQPAYADSFENSWSSGSTATVNLSNTGTYVHSGSKSIEVTPKAAGDGLYLKHAFQDASEYQTISFWINGGPVGGQLLEVVGTASGNVPQTAYSLAALKKNTWLQVVVPLAAIGVSQRGDFDGFWIKDRSGKVQPIFYVDDVVFSVDPVVNPATTISVDAAQQTAISPYIYGVNSTDFAGMGKGFTFTRLGGNRLTAYNWETNASNAGSDYYFDNDGYMGATNESGWTGRTFVQASIAGGATPLLTIPTAGYVSADKDGTDVKLTPNWLAVRFKVSLPSKPGGKYVYPPVTTDAYVYEDEYVNYIKHFGTTAHPVWYQLDNEPDLWSSTHSEIHPVAVTYAELLANSTTYATSIKSVAPNALVFGPVNYGWEGYRTLQGAVDADNRDFMSFYLAGMNAAGTKAKKRLLDVLDLHWYPEATGDGQRITTDNDTPLLAAARVQATRSLWDSTYVENSWITQSLGNKAIELLPDTFNRIATNYPGTKLSFTEYNYGGGNAISGAVAQADVLGVFGRYGVFAASNWGLSSTEVAELAGFKAFINYDGAGSSFAPIGVKVSGETASQNSVYASVDKATPSRMTLVVINKTTGATPFTIDLTKFAPNTAKAYAVTDGSYAKAVPFAVTLGLTSVSFTAPPMSVITIELKTKTP